MNNLFDDLVNTAKPLASRMRPEKIEDLLGQESLLSKNGLLYTMLKENKLSSMLIFGPSGCGKSSLALLISKLLNYDFYSLFASTASVNDIKDIAKKARIALEHQARKSVLFLDEIHRFNKAQQDALLYFVEEGLLILIAASSQSPYQSVNKALLSRLLVFEFEKLSDENIKSLIERSEIYLKIKIDEKIKKIIIQISQGDARIALNHVQLYNDNEDKELVLKQFLKRASHSLQDQSKHISALIKSMRGSDVNSALYWLARLLKANCDILYIARRLVIFASEDIGLANSNAILLANAALNAAMNIGEPEIDIIFAHVVIYLASSTKSDSAIKAIKAAFKDIEQNPHIEVPLELKPSFYKNPHEYENNFLKTNYGKNKANFYKAGANKNEEKIKKFLKELWK